MGKSGRKAMVFYDDGGTGTTITASTIASTSNVIYFNTFADYISAPEHLNSAKPPICEDEIGWLRRRVDEVLLKDFAA